MRNKTLALVSSVLAGLLVCGTSLPAQAALIWGIRIENPPAVIGPMDTVVIKGVLFNSPTSDRNLGVISGGFLGEPPGFDFEIGGYASSTSGCGFRWGPPGGSPHGSLQEQFHGVDLAPGQTFTFVFGSCTKPAGPFSPGIFEIWGEIQLYESSAVRPMVGRSSDWVRWMVSDAAPRSAVIDVKPGSFPNSINPRSEGVIPVAILTTPELAASDVDLATVHFGFAGTEAKPQQSALEDVDGDGDIDLILHFPTQSTGLPCGATSATLTGSMFDGQLMRGAESIITVGCK